MSKDKLGNHLKVGDRVLFNPDAQGVVGEIINCVPKMTLALQGGRENPAYITIQFNVTLRDVANLGRFPMIVKVHTPDENTLPKAEA